MSFLYEKDGRDLFCIYQQSIDFDEQMKLYNLKKIPNTNTIVVGTIGSGKSTFLMSYIWELYQNGYKILFLTCKPRSDFDNCYPMFPIPDMPESEYHRDFVENTIGLQPLNFEQCKGLVRILHPFTFNLPKSKKSDRLLSLPEIQFFTFSLKNLTAESLTAILQTDVDASVVRTCLRILQDTKDDENIWDFLRILTEKILSKDGLLLDYSPESMFIPFSTAGDKKGVRSIRDSFLVFRENYMIQPENFDMHLDFVKLLNENRKIDYLITKYVTEERMKFFTLIQFTKEIEKALDSGLVKNPICLVIEEVKNLLPKTKTDQVSYERELSKIFRGFMSTSRSAGRGITTIGTTQNYKLTDADFIGNVSDVILFKLNEDDLFFLQDRLHLDKGEIDSIRELSQGHFMWLEDLKRGYSTKFYAFLPPFAIAEEKYDFFDMYKKYYSEKFKPPIELYKRMLNHRKEVEETSFKKLKEFEKKFLEEAGKEKESKSEVKEKDKKEKSEFKSLKEMKLQKKLDKEEAMKYAYMRKKRNPKISWVTIGNELDISFPTAKVYAIDYARSISDNNFVTLFNIDYGKPEEEQKENLLDESQNTL